MSNLVDHQHVEKARNAIGALPTIQEDQIEQDTVDFKKMYKLKAPNSQLNRNAKPSQVASGIQIVS